jgi:peptidyl-prolyl cis-trans isomerase SurA
MMMKQRLWAVLCVTLMMLPTVAQDNVIDEVVWVVGDEAILKSDVEQARMYFMMSGQQMEGEPYCVIPEQLAIQKLFLHQAAIDSIEVTEQEVLNG